MIFFAAPGSGPGSGLAASSPPARTPRRSCHLMQPAQALALETDAGPPPGQRDGGPPLKDPLHGDLSGEDLLRREANGASSRPPLVRDERYGRFSSSVSDERFSSSVSDERFSSSVSFITHGLLETPPQRPGGRGAARGLTPRRACCGKPSGLVPPV